MKKMRKYKLIPKISLVLLLAVMLNMAIIPSVGMAARLTSAKDTLTRTQVSGTGTATAGYTQSTDTVTDAFIFVAATNEDIYWDPDGSGLPGDTTTDLITSGGLIAEVIYTGDEVAAAVKTALEATDGDADDTYTVTYNESTDKFTIRGDGGNTQNANIDWDDAVNCTAAATLGYTADDTSIRDADKTSDAAVSFIVLNDVNDNFTIKVDGVQSGTLDVAAGNYTTGTTLATAITAAIDADGNVTTLADATYASNKIKITSASTGANSTVRVVEDGTDDFLKTVKLIGDFPVDGAATGTLVAANHTIVFTATTAVATTGKVVVDFPSGFTLPAALNFEDVDMAGDVAGEFTLVVGGAEGAGNWGVTVVTGDGGSITFISGGGAGDDIDAGETVTIEIGRNAAAGVTGIEQITNPTTVGLYQILVKTTNAADATIDDTYIGVYIVADDSVVITATVDPVLSLSLYGGTSIDFGTLEPNAYHKLGGARNAYGSIDLQAITPSGTHESEIVTVRGIIYEFSDDGVIATTSYAKVDIVDNENNYLTAVQVATNLYRAINNYDGDLVRANVDPTDTDKVWVMATTPGSGPNSYTLATAVTGTAVSGATFANGADGYNRKSNLVDYGAATGSNIGNGATGTNIVVSTNAAGGYVLSVQNTDSNGATDNADGLTNGTVEISQWSGTFGYGVLASSQSARYGDGTSVIIESAYQGDGAGDLPGTASTTAATLAQLATGDVTPATTAGDNIAIEYNIRISPDQAAGLYTDTITYILTSTF